MESIAYLDYLVRLLEERDYSRVSSSFERIQRALEQESLRPAVAGLLSRIAGLISEQIFEGLSVELVKLNRLLLNLSFSEEEGQEIIGKLETEEGVKIPDVEKTQILEQIKQEKNFEDAQEIVRKQIHSKKQSPENSKVVIRIEHMGRRGTKKTSPIVNGSKIMNSLFRESYITDEGFSNQNSADTIMKVQYEPPYIIARERAMSESSLDSLCFTKPLCFIRVQEKKEIHFGDIYILGSSYFMITQVQPDEICLQYCMKPPEINTIEITDKSIIIGRSSECKLNLHDNIMSSMHAKIEKIRDKWYLEDLSSKNGTWKALHNKSSLDHDENSPFVKIDHGIELLIRDCFYTVMINPL